MFRYAAVTRAIAATQQLVSFCDAITVARQTTELMLTEVLVELQVPFG
jgi:hypothetical protein